MTAAANEIIASKRLRLKHALELMRSDGSSIGDIVAAVGYADQGQLSLHFRAQYDKSPRAFRGQL